MPTPEQILAGLTAIANRAQPLAIGWHAALAVTIIALLAGWRPSRRIAGVLLAIPLISVAAMAWSFGNPFNGLVFALVAVLLVTLALRLPEDAVTRGPAWAFVVGVLMVGFGWVYPHFLESGAPLAYLYAAPFGLVPCPTLSAVIGFALLGGGLRARGWSGVLAGAGVFYALFGALRLGVSIDIFLLVGALALGALAMRRK